MPNELRAFAIVDASERVLIVGRDARARPERACVELPLVHSHPGKRGLSLFSGAAASDPDECSVCLKQKRSLRDCD
jgi:hypothetical protein